MSPYEAEVITIMYRAGALIRNDVRSQLDGVRLKSDQFTYIESKGFLSSDFHMKGPRYLLRALAMLLEARYNEPRED